MNDYDRTNRDWAFCHRASPWPLVRLVIVVFCLGLCFGVALSLAFSAPWSSEIPAGEPVASDTWASGRMISPASRVADHGAVRASIPVNREAGDLTRTGSIPDGASVVLARTTSLEHTSTVLEPIAQSIEQIITNAAIEFGVSPATMLRRAFCESTNNPNAVGRAQEVSIFQFMPSTWVLYAPRLGYSLREIGHVEAQARVAAYMESIGEGRQWTCR